MRYRMKRNLQASDGDFAVKNEYGRDVLLIGGLAGGAGEKLSFRDTRRRELAYVRRKVLPAGPAYEIVYADELHAVVGYDALAGPQATFTADLPGPDDLCAAGDFSACEYAFTRDGRTVATVSRTAIPHEPAAAEACDSYGVDVDKGEDEVLILASALAIDLCCREAEKA